MAETNVATSTRDAAGNDLSAVEIPLGGAIIFVEYKEANKITAESMAETVKDVKLPEDYKSDNYLGLIKQDAAFQDSRDADDATEFFQSGYSIPGSPTLSTAFTVAENNRHLRRITLGEPDENGVYKVDDIIQPDKWCAYQEEALKGGRVRRRAGVVQITGNEPEQSERGQVKGAALTATWVPDPLYEQHRYYESIYDPTLPTAGGAAAASTPTKSAGK